MPTVIMQANTKVLGTFGVPVLPDIMYGDLVKFKNNDGNLEVVSIVDTEKIVYNITHQTLTIDTDGQIKKIRFIPGRIFDFT